MGEVAQADVVLLTAGEVLEQRAEGAGFADTEVDLHPGLNHHAGLLGAVDQHVFDHRQFHQCVSNCFRIGRGADQVDIADGFFPAPEATSREHGADVWALLSQGGNHLFRDRQGLADGRAAAHGLESLDVA